MQPSIRQVIAGRLREWMEGRVDLDTQQKLEKASGVSQTTISRLLNAQSGTTIDSLEGIAEAFGRSAWELVAPQEIGALLANAPAAIMELPESERAKVSAFVEFVLGQARTPRPVLNMEDVEQLEGPHRQAIKRAAQRKDKETEIASHRRRKSRRT